MCIRDRLIIEHNLEVIKTADWVIDLGPEGGARGGRIVYQGIPKNCINKPESYTGKFLGPSFNLTGESRALMSN